MACSNRFISRVLLGSCYIFGASSEGMLRLLTVGFRVRGTVLLIEHSTVRLAARVQSLEHATSSSISSGSQTEATLPDSRAA